MQADLAVSLKQRKLITSDLEEYDKEAARYLYPQDESLSKKHFELEEKLQKTERGRELLEKYWDNYPRIGGDFLLNFEATVNMDNYIIRRKTDEKRND